MSWIGKNIVSIIGGTLILVAGDALLFLLPYYLETASLHGYTSSDYAPSFFASLITSPFLAAGLCYGNEILKSQDENKQVTLIKRSLAFAATGAIILALATYIIIF